MMEENRRATHLIPCSIRTAKYGSLVQIIRLGVSSDVYYSKRGVAP
jgi:hypothetical protein